MWLRPGVQLLRALRMSHFFTCFTFSLGLAVCWLRVFVFCLFVLSVVVLVCCCVLQVLWDVLIFNREF